MGQKSWLNNNEKNVPPYFCQQQKILAYIKTFYTFSMYTVIWRGLPAAVYRESATRNPPPL